MDLGLAPLIAIASLRAISSPPYAICGTVSCPSQLPAISGVSDLREAISQLASDVSVEDNLLAAEVCHFSVMHATDS